MKSMQFLSTFAVLGLAASVTAGSMYVTVRAAAQQEEAAVADVEDAALAPTAEAIAEQIADEMNAPLAPDAIISNRSEDIVLDETGSFDGRLGAYASGNQTVAASDMSVQIIQDGVSNATTTTDKNGAFRFKGLKPGVAAVLASSENGFMLIGVRLVAADEKNPAGQHIGLESTIVDGVNLRVAKSIIESQLTDGDVRFVDAPAEREQDFRLGEGEPATSVGRHAVQLQADGSLRGTVNVMDDRTGRVREILDLTVYFIRDGQITAKSEVENTGEFLVEGLSAGTYAAVGVGKDGTFAFSLEVVSAGQAATAGAFSPSEYQTASLLAPAEFSVALANSSNFNTQNANSLTNGQINPSGDPPGPVASNPVPPAPAGGATGGGGGAAGGGAGAGGGGGGGLGALLGAGIAGGVGYLVGQEDTPASPAL